jgi:retinol dehydrogenase 14
VLVTGGTGGIGRATALGLATMGNTRHVTTDGLERTLAVNHLAPFLLTSLLLAQLEQSGHARVVTNSSHAHSQGRIDFDDLQCERSYSGARAYNQSKLADVLFSYSR